MTTDERNFRSSYYEKVGCNSVEEKKSLNKLLQDDIRNLSKLKQFCLSYTVPNLQRSLLWCLIMGIMPLHKNSTDYIRKQLDEMYHDLLSAVTVMRYIDPGKPKEIVLHTMWLLENNRLIHFYTDTQADDKQFIAIVQTLLKIFDDDVETYCIAKEFYQYTREIKRDCPKLKEQTQLLLKREDIALFNHLENLGLFDSNSKLIDHWYATCFAGIFCETCLVKIWDKICGGSRKIVVFLFLEKVKNIREQILKCQTQTELKNVFETMAKDVDGVIVNKAIKTCQSKANSEFEFAH